MARHKHLFSSPGLPTGDHRAVLRTATCASHHFSHNEKVACRENVSLCDSIDLHHAVLEGDIMLVMLLNLRG